MSVPSFGNLQATGSERRLARNTAVVLLLASAVGLTFHPATVEIHSVLVMIVGALLITELLSAYVFFSQFVETRQLPLLFVGCAYLTTGCVLVPYLITFPDVFASGVLLGASSQTAIALWIVWHATFPAFVIAYAFAHAPSVPLVGNARRTAAAAGQACMAFAAIVGYLCVRFGAALPALTAGTRHFTSLTTLVMLPIVVALDGAAIVAVILITRMRSQTQLWLTIAVVASALDAILGVTSDRYALGWYIGKSLAIVSSTVLLVVFLRSLARLYRNVRRMYYSLQRVREREAAEAADQRSIIERVLMEARPGASLGTWQYDPDGQRRQWSRALFELLEIAPHANPAQEEYLARVHAEDREAYARTTAAAFLRAEPFEFIHRILRRDGTVRWLELRADCTRGEADQRLYWFGTVADISERVESERRIAEIAFRDSTTDLPNRAAMRNAISEFIGAHDASNGRSVALLFLDIDRFKIVNEVFGHPTGDAFLRAVGGRLRDAIPDAFVARSGGDEFVVVVPEAASIETVDAIAKRVLRVASQPIVIAGREFQTTASIGISLFPNDAETVDELICNADIAMYRAKAGGGNAACVFSHAMREAQIERLGLEADIRSACADGSFQLHYQPLMNLHTAEVCGAEALLRWTHATRGVVSPALLVDVAEGAGLMGRIGDWVLQTGIAQRAAWQHIYPDIRIAINVSMGQLQSEAFDDRLGALLSGARVSAPEIELEITETVAMEGAEVAEQMRRCLRRGVHFSLDDFGTHYSSLTYLQRLPVDKIKIDRSFVHELPGNEKDAAIVKAVIQLAHSLGRTVVAEGVETAAQLNWLREANCDVVQGYHIGRPMQAADFEAWLLRRSAVVA